MKGGLEAVVLEGARIPIRGSKREYTVKRHGMGIQFRRCYEFDYIDKHNHEPTTATCSTKKVINIPQRTFNCYNEVADILKSLRRGKKGRPSINYKVLAMVACNKSGTTPTRVSEPMTPSVIAAAIGETQKTTRKAMEQLVKQRKLVTDKTIDVVNERQVRLPPKYQRVFEDFIKGEKEERVLAGMRRIFGKGVVPATVAPDLPEAE